MVFCAGCVMAFGAMVDGACGAGADGVWATHTAGAKQQARMAARRRVLDMP
jgi:hypothetical protein